MRRRSQHAKQSRRAILTAARRRFERDGYASSSLVDIAEDAGLTTGAIYHHFDTKRALFTAVYIECCDRMRHHVEGAIGEADDLASKAAAGVRIMLNLSHEPYVRQIMISDAPIVLGDDMRLIDERSYLGIVRSLVKEGEALGMGQGLDPEIVARLLLALLVEASALAGESIDETAVNKVETAVLRIIAALMI